MIFESFIMVELCIIAIIFIFEWVRGNYKRKTEKISERHFDGRIIINTKDVKQEVFRLEYEGNVADIPTKEYIIFKVVLEDL